MKRKYNHGCQKKKCKSCQCGCECKRCRCSGNNNCCSVGLISVRVYGFNESGFSYVIVQGGQELERSVSFSVTGMEVTETFPFVRPKTISGAIGRNGQIISGTGFTVSHTSGTGSYRVTFNPPLSMVMPDQEPRVDIIPDVEGFLTQLPEEDNVSDIVTGTIMADGSILEGTTLPNGMFAFDVVKNNNFPGYYTVKFKPDLNVVLLLPIGLQIEVIDLESNVCIPCPNDDIIGQGALKQNVDKTGFTYRTYVETLTQRIYTDLPIAFTAILTRKSM